MSEASKPAKQTVINDASIIVGNAQEKVSKAVAATQLRTSIISGLLVLAGVVSTSFFDFFSKDQAQKIEQTRIALALLSGDGRDSTTPARRFAIALLEQSTGV